MTAGYYRYPTIHKDTIVFVCEDDLWSVSAKGGLARRLTANLALVSRPMLSPNGSLVAYTGRDEGHAEVYCMSTLSGHQRRLTYQGANIGAQVVGWSSDGKSVIYASEAGQPFARMLHLWQVHVETGRCEQLPYGPARSISYGPKGAAVIGRNTSDPAFWKRYRGGTAGDLWIDPTGDGNFTRLLKLPGNLGYPMWIGDRIYFLSDHEGIGNIYSCLITGDDLQRHTHHDEYYVRNPATDGKRITYHAGADIYVFDPKPNKDRMVAVEFHSPQVQRNRKFVNPTSNLDAYALHPEGHSAVITTRGRPFTMALWEGAVTQYGERNGIRYRLTRWSSDGSNLITISDADGEEAIELHPLDKKTPPKRFSDLDIGRPLALYVSPRKDRCHVAFPNHRNELVFVNLDDGSLKVLDRSPHERLTGVSWSPDGEWLAYGIFNSQHTACIKLAKIETGETFQVSHDDFIDVSPAFDPEGKYLYFLSVRVFNPVYANHYFDLNFPKAMKPYVVTLQKNLKSPFLSEPKAPGRRPPEDLEEMMEKKEKDKDSDDEKEDDEHVIQPITIDIDGIRDRVVEFPVEEGIYGAIRGIKGKALYTVFPVRGSFDQKKGEDPDGVMKMYDFDEQKESTVVEGVDSFKLSRHSKTLIYQAGSKLRVWRSGMAINSNTPGFNRESGWLDLSRIKISVIPPAEWRQMYREAWRLQREHFWTEDMAGIDWEHIYKRYLPLIDRLCTRSEVSDLLWEMQGELGTSHCYEFGGDYRQSPSYRLGMLGADLAYDPTDNAWKITHIVSGDRWDADWDSPLRAPGLNIEVGDVILEVAGYPVNAETSPHELLVNQAGEEVTLTLKTDNEEGRRCVTVKTLKTEQQARYREWVEKNRDYVHQQSKGQLGYVHIPDMGPRGYAEFHRYYLPELQYKGLIVDVRYNGGGHVSQLILEKLAQKRIGYDITRWGQPVPFPSYSVLGPIVALTNEHAGSDGDIFSHSFKLMKLGTLVGKRTWGGVVGIWPRHSLVDGSITTQPEFSFWFNDVAWNVENYGTDPDIEVDITPQDFRANQDPQLAKAIDVALKSLKKKPPKVPEFKDRPSRALPKLPN